MPDRFPSRSQKLLEEFIARGEQLDQLQTRVNELLGAEIGLTQDLSVEGVLERLAVSARELVGADRAVARLLGPVWAQRSRTAAGAAGVPAPDPVAASVAVVAEDPAGDPSVLSIPLRAKGIVLGEVVLSAKDQRAFAAEDEEVLAALAAAGGPAVWNAVLYEESQRRQAWLEAVLEAAAVLVSGGDLGFGHGLDAVAERALRASGSALAMVLLPRAGALRIGAVAGMLPTREMLIVPNPPAPSGPDAGARVGDAGEWFLGEAALGLGQAIAVRLGEGAPEGALLLLAKGDGQVYSPVDLSSATLFAAHVGLAIRLRALMQERARDVISADRRRIARDLHDLVIQHLFAAGLSLQRIGPLNGQSWAEARIAGIVAELDVAVHELREAVYALGSEAGEAERDSFSAVLLQTVRQALGQTAPEVQVTIEGPAGAIPEPTEELLIALAAGILGDTDGPPLPARISLSVTVRDNDVELAIAEHGARPGRSSLIQRADRLAEQAGPLGMATRAATSDGVRLVWAIPLGTQSA